METIAFTELVKLIHPDINPNIKDAGTKMTEAVKNKKNPEILYELGVRWGVIKKTVKEIIMLVVGDMVTFKRPTCDNIEFGTIVGIDSIDDYANWTKIHSLNIYTTDNRCLKVNVKSLETEKHGIKFVRKVDTMTVARHRSEFIAKSKPSAPYQEKPKPHPEADHGTWETTYNYSTGTENHFSRATRKTTEPVNNRVTLRPNMDYRYENINIFTKYGNKVATRTTEKRVYFEHLGKETWKNFNASTYAWRM